MRPARLLGGTALILALAPQILAQPEPYAATVTVPQVEVRSGPSDDPKMYPTNALRQGDVVQVVRERDDGWLEIKPPPGSFSWINARFLEKQGANLWAVVGDPESPVPVLVGSHLRDSKPTVEGARVRRGTLLVSIGDVRPADDGMWLPIQPPPAEVRYLRKDAVARQPGSVLAAAAPVPPTPLGPGASFAQPLTPAPLSSPAAAASLPPSAGGDSRWVQAQQMEQTNVEEAIRLYLQLGSEIANTNHDLAMQCYNRAQWLRDGRRGSVPAGYAGSRPSEAHYTGRPEARLAPLPSYGTATTGNIYCTPCPPAAQQSGYNRRMAVLPPPSAVPGYLRAAQRSVDGKRTYALMNDQGQLVSYVTAEPGVNLDAYLNRNVEVFGPVVYRTDVRANYVTATRVAPLP